MYCFRTIQRRFQYASEEESFKRTYRADSRSHWKSSSADDPEQSLRVLMDVVKPWMETVASGRLYVFQDGASAHASHLIQNWLSDNDMFGPRNSGLPTAQI